MLNLFKYFIKNFNTFSNLANCKIPPPSNIPLKMSVVKHRYDGRSKKRAWEERRSDKGESLGAKPKQQKVESKDEKASENMETDSNKVERIKRRKYALLMGYSGVNYLGMQRNPGMKTIEEELFKALLNVGVIDQIGFDQVQNMSFQRAARTDKGVSAVRQVVSLKLNENYDLEKVNMQLPDEIRVFDCKRVTKGFNSKTQCDSRTYIYLLPTIAFYDKSDQTNQRDYRLDDDIFAKVNKILQNYHGTKNFHNYTSKKKPKDPSAKRFIISFECEKPFVRQDVEFAILKVRGQSFMMHQIRKMIGMLLAVVRGLASEETLQNSFKQDFLSIPRAPGLGLMLEYVHYDRYNYRYGEDGMHPKLLWDEVDDKVNEFKEKFIFPTIINAEVQEERMLFWLKEKLSRHRYDDLENESDDENGGDEDDDEEKVANEANNDKIENKSATVGS